MSSLLAVLMRLICSATPRTHHHPSWPRLTRRHNRCKYLTMYKYIGPPSLFPYPPLEFANEASSSTIRPGATLSASLFPQSVFRLYVSLPLDTGSAYTVVRYIASSSSEHLAFDSQYPARAIARQSQGHSQLHTYAFYLARPVHFSVCPLCTATATNPPLPGGEGLLTLTRICIYTPIRMHIAVQQGSL